MPRSLNYSTEIALVAHNIRSAHNVGSLFRTAEGLNLSELILSGYTPYPKEVNDQRLAHIAERADKQIQKTALGSDKSIKWRHVANLAEAIENLKNLGFRIYGLEQDKKSKPISDVRIADKSVIVVGNEVSGLDVDALKLCDEIIEIPMFGKKESFNVVQAAAMALFYFRF